MRDLARHSFDCRLPNEFGTELDVARAARSDYGIRFAYIRSKYHPAHRAGIGQIVVHGEHVEVRVIQDVEYLGAQLKTQLFTKIERFRYGHIPILEGRSTEDITSHVSEGSLGGRGDDGISGNEAAVICELVEGGLVVGPRGVNALLVSANHVAASVHDKGAGVNEGNRVGGRGLNVFGRSGDVPAIFELASRRSVVYVVEKTVGFSAFEHGNGVDLPSLQQLPMALDGRQRVSNSKGEPVANIEVAVAALGTIVETVLRNVGEIAGGGVNGVRVGVTGEQIQAVRIFFGEGHLQGVVSGVGVISEGLKESESRKTGTSGSEPRGWRTGRGQGSRGLFAAGEVTVENTAGGKNAGSGESRVGLIVVEDAVKIDAVIGHVGHLQQGGGTEGLLDVEIPIGDVGSAEVRTGGKNIAGAIRAARLTDGRKKNGTGTGAPVHQGRVERLREERGDRSVAGTDAGQAAGVQIQSSTAKHEGANGGLLEDEAAAGTYNRLAPAENVPSDAEPRGKIVVVRWIRLTDALADLNDSFGRNEVREQIAGIFDGISDVVAQAHGQCDAWRNPETILNEESE